MAKKKISIAAALRRSVAFKPEPHPVGAFGRGNRLIQRSEGAQKLIKEFGVKGSPVTTVGSQVIPVAIVSNLAAGSDRDFNVTRWAWGWGETPAGAIFGKLSFNLPSTSGVFAKFYKAILHSAAVCIVRVTIETGSAGGTLIGTSQKGFQDSRLSLTGPSSPTRLPAMELRFDNSGGLGAVYMKFVLQPEVPVFLDFGGVVIRPGTRLHFESETLATAYDVSAQWTETNVS